MHSMVDPGSCFKERLLTENDDELLGGQGPIFHPGFLLPCAPSQPLPLFHCVIIPFHIACRSTTDEQERTGQPNAQCLSWFNKQVFMRSGAARTSSGTEHKAQLVSL